MIAARLARVGERIRHRGDAVHCPVCGSRFDSFRAHFNRPGAICRRCGAHERHRALWLYLDRVRPELLPQAPRLLHFAPEHALEDRLRERVLDYVSADLDPAKGELQLDLHALALPDASFDGVLCSHVLEHVADDVLAMRELARVVAPGGWCIVMVPLDLDRGATDEDPSLTDPAERERRFWQHDHVRLYSPDIEDRLAGAGFTVETWQPPEAWRAPHGLLASDIVFTCRPR